MDIVEKIKITLSNINFADRYRIISQQFQYTGENFQDYQVENVKKIIESFGYIIKYNKSETFFKTIEMQGSFKFQFNISLKYGMVELIWAVWLNNVILQKVSSPWSVIFRFVADTEERVKLPIFRNYDDLREILKEAFSIYEDFKKELLKQSET